MDIRPLPDTIANVTPGFLTAALALAILPLFSGAVLFTNAFELIDSP